MEQLEQISKSTIPDEVLVQLERNSTSIEQKRESSVKSVKTLNTFMHMKKPLHIPQDHWDELVVALN